MDRTEIILKYWMQYWNSLDEKKRENTSFETFKEGWMALERKMASDKAKAEKRKSKSFVMDDFVLYNKTDNRYFINGVIYYNKGEMVTTDGHYCLVHKDDSYGKELEGKLIRLDTNAEIDGQYPNYSKIVPDIAEMKVTCGITAENMHLIAKTDKRTCIDKLYNKVIKIADTKLSMQIIKIVDKFLTCYPDAKVYMHKEDEKGKDYKDKEYTIPKEYKSYMLVDEKSSDKLVIATCNEKSHCDFEWNEETKELEIPSKEN